MNFVVATLLKWYLKAANATLAVNCYAVICLDSITIDEQTYCGKTVLPYQIHTLLAVA
jgi:hypothetical protein